MKQQTIQKPEPNPSVFLDFDDDDSLYKNCNNCGQGQYPFKHGLCILCGENNWIVDFEIRKIEKLGIKELVDN